MLTVVLEDCPSVSFQPMTGRHLSLTVSVMGRPMVPPFAQPTGNVLPIRSEAYRACTGSLPLTSKGLDLSRTLMLSEVRVVLGSIFWSAYLTW